MCRFRLLVFLLTCCIIPTEAHLTGVTAAPTLFDPLMPGKVLIFTAEVLKKDLQFQVEKRTSNDPMIRAKGPIEHFVARMEFTLKPTEYLYASGVDEPKLEQLKVFSV